MKLKIGKQYRRILVVLIIIWIVQDSYHYHHKYKPIDLTSKESIIQSLKSDKELLSKVSTIMLEKMEGTEEKVIRINARGLDGYRTYHNEALREVFQKYDLIFIQISRISDLKISFGIGRKREGVTYYGFYYKEDGQPKTWGAVGELKESGDGYEYESPGNYTYYTEPAGDGWFYYETIYYRGLVL